MRTSYSRARRSVVALLVILLGQAPVRAIALDPSPSTTVAPSSPVERMPVDASAMRIILVEWRIKKGMETEFLEYWSTRSTIPNRSGLVGEFLSRVESTDAYPWMVWSLDDRWTTFVNVGFWRAGEDFQDQVGRFIDNSRPPLPFEADRRRRVLVAPERWRVGGTPLPLNDHQGVR